MFRTGKFSMENFPPHITNDNQKIFWYGTQEGTKQKCLEKYYIINNGLQAA
jgi:hypothetical protein